MAVMPTWLQVVTPIATGVALAFLGWLSYNVWGQQRDMAEQRRGHDEKMAQLTLRVAALEMETRTKLATIEQRCSQRGENIGQLYELVHRVDKALTGIAAQLGVKIE